MICCFFFYFHYRLDGWINSAGIINGGFYSLKNFQVNERETLCSHACTLYSYTIKKVQYIPRLSMQGPFTHMIRVESTLAFPHANNKKCWRSTTLLPQFSLFVPQTDWTDGEGESEQAWGWLTLLGRLWWASTWVTTGICSQTHSRTKKRHTDGTSLHSPASHRCSVYFWWVSKVLSMSALTSPQNNLRSVCALIKTKN